MEERLPFFRTLPLFRDMTDGEILRALACFQAREAHTEQAQLTWEYGKGALCGIITQGRVSVQQEDLRGNRFILHDFGPGDILSGSSLAATGVQPYFLALDAGTAVILLQYEDVMNPCCEQGGGCRAHLLILRNIAQALAQREILLLHKVDCLSKRTTREKILAFLHIQAKQHGTRGFLVPYTRQELADLLSVDRSAMCTELTRMQQDGLIRYERKWFELPEE